ncbi:hypothetical protein DSO57_1002805 [Entomophthora muscae]|uniref:Uncharacterized protein n=1 Tax=Entomophthora muscae TaxID=34485 RepID=A0ACC2SAN9_9FUNG|nr:hypothetical protein DSO57_1002805 [Entomophthora muscae]
MSVKGGPGYVADNYIFNCNNQKRQTKSKHFVCEDKTCGAWLNTEGWEQVTAEMGEHSCEPPNHLITQMLKWVLVQVIPTSANLCASDLDINALQHLKPKNLKLVPTQEQLVKFISNKCITANLPPPKASDVLLELTLTHKLKKLPSCKVSWSGEDDCKLKLLTQ